METAVYVALSRQMGLRRQLDVIANNIANANTTAFKGEEVLFAQYLPPGRPGGEAHRISYAQDIGTVLDLDEGAFAATERPLDIAISGPGYLVVQTPAGERYTRNGHLKLDDQGQLVVGDGHVVLDESGRPILLDPQDGAPVIAGDGTVSTRQGVIGKLALVRFVDPGALRLSGGGLFEADQPPQPAPMARVMQGMLEGANVEPVVEMTRMIDVLRAYQTNARMMETANDLMSRAIERLGHVRS